VEAIAGKIFSRSNRLTSVGITVMAPSPQRGHS